MRWIVALVALVALAAPAFAHGDAAWIQGGSYQGPDGTHCCGVADCFPIPDGGVGFTESGGYVIKENGESIPADKALFSEDQRFWVCWRGRVWEIGGEMAPKKSRCFFVPAPGT